MSARKNRGRISPLVADFADQIDSHFKEAVLFEYLASRRVSTFLDTSQQIRISDLAALGDETEDFFQVRLE
jgi:hypothetical protein